MGAQARPNSALQGFGYTKAWGRTGMAQGSWVGYEGTRVRPHWHLISISQLNHMWTHLLVSSPVFPLPSWEEGKAGWPALLDGQGEARLKSSWLCWPFLLLEGQGSRLLWT